MNPIKFPGFFGEKQADAPTLYAPEKEKGHLTLTEAQKEAVRNITLGIDEIDETVRSMAVEDVIRTLENGHPLNRVITKQEGGVAGYIACEDFIPREAYIKYFGTTGQTGRNLLREIPAFLEYAKQQGYVKLNFHGWNDRLNHVLEHFGFKRIRTDRMADFAVDFYENALVDQKPQEHTDEERKRAFEEKYLQRINQEYQQTLATFSPDARQGKERLIADAFTALSGRLAAREGFEFGDRQQAVLKLKLARYFQKTDTLDESTLFDAIVESPKFINTDKGSLNRLLEVHEEKTLQKTAEIRKQRAEITGNVAFNPYEALFTTDSGNYYMARLLNMPHLQEESAYMNHCVGTSDSYVNRMKRGEVEILSFRRAPKVNPETQKLEGDTPVMTIEYDLKTGVIEQMKKHGDEYLSPEDPFFSDVIDALKQLRTTATDDGTLRNFKKIAPSELTNIAVADYHILTEHGEVSFRDFNPDDGSFVLKMGVMEITPDMPRKDAARIVRIVEGIDCKPEDIARSRDEVTEATKIYIGEFFSGFFEWLPDHIEHIYTSFPEEKVERRTIKGGTLSKEQLKHRIEQAAEEKKIQTSSWALSIFEGKDIDGNDFATLEHPEDIDLVRISVQGLGFPNGATTKQIYDKAESLGLELCPAETGPQYRLQYMDQPMNEIFWIAMKQISGSGGNPLVFNLCRDADGLWLHGFFAHPGGRWVADCSFVFRLRKYVEP